MSTPASIKRVEEKKKKAAEKNSTTVQLSKSDIKPLSQTSINKIQPIKSNTDFTKDTLGGEQYTSFEKGAMGAGPKKLSRNGQALKRRPRELKPRDPPPKQEVIDLPLDVDTSDFKIDKDNVICFSGIKHWLSNMHKSSFTIDGVEYPSVEHYYQACKVYVLGSEDLSVKISTVKNPQNTKGVAKSILKKVTKPEEIEKWRVEESPKILLYALTAKFTQNEELKKQLLDTGDGIIAHAFQFDSLFATGCGEEEVKKWAEDNNGQLLKIPLNFVDDTNVHKYVPLVGSGKNFLGYLLMRVRADIRDGKSEKVLGEAADRLKKINIKK